MIIYLHAGQGTLVCVMGEDKKRLAIVDASLLCWEDKDITPMCRRFPRDCQVTCLSPEFRAWYSSPVAGASRLSPR